jgi:hypothetical protein
VEGVKRAPIYNLVWMTFMAAKQTFVQFLYRKERGELYLVIERFVEREEFVIMLFYFQVCRAC